MQWTPDKLTALRDHSADGVAKLAVRFQTSESSVIQIAHRHRIHLGRGSTFKNERAQAQRWQRIMPTLKERLRADGMDGAHGWITGA